MENAIGDGSDGNVEVHGDFRDFGFEPGVGGCERCGWSKTLEKAGWPYK